MATEATRLSGNARSQAASALRTPRSRWMAKVCAVIAVDQRDPAVAELDQQPRRLLERAFIVDVGNG